MRVYARAFVCRCESQFEPFPRSRTAYCTSCTSRARTLSLPYSNQKQSTSQRECPSSCGNLSPLGFDDVFGVRLPCWAPSGARVELAIKTGTQAQHPRPYTPHTQITTTQGPDKVHFRVLGFVLGGGSIGLYGFRANSLNPTSSSGCWICMLSGIL